MLLVGDVEHRLRLYVTHRDARQSFAFGTHVVQLVERQQRRASSRCRSLHVGDGCAMCPIFVAPVHQSDRFCPVAELLRPIERRVAAADYHDALTLEVVRVGHPVEDATAVPLVRARLSETAR